MRNKHWEPKKYPRCGFDLQFNVRFDIKERDWVDVSERIITRVKTESRKESEQLVVYREQYNGRQIF